MTIDASWDERIFAGRPEPLRLFRAIRRYLEALGPLTIRSADAHVSFRVRRPFVWVALPPDDDARPGLRLTFSVDERIDDPRIVDAFEPHPGRWTHRVDITDETDLDPSVERWLRRAYHLADVELG